MKKHPALRLGHNGYDDDFALLETPKIIDGENPVWLIDTFENKRNNMSARQSYAINNFYKVF